MWQDALQEFSATYLDYYLVARLLRSYNKIGRSGPDVHNAVGYAGEAHIGVIRDALQEIAGFVELSRQVSLPKELAEYAAPSAVPLQDDDVQCLDISTLYPFFKRPLLTQEQKHRGGKRKRESPPPSPPAKKKEAKSTPKPNYQEVYDTNLAKWEVVCSKPRTELAFTEWLTSAVGGGYTSLSQLRDLLDALDIPWSSEDSTTELARRLFPFCRQSWPETRSNFEWPRAEGQKLQNT